MRVFWPRGLARDTGLAVGWRLPSPSPSPCPGVEKAKPAEKTETLVVVDMIDSPGAIGDTTSGWPLEPLARVVPHADAAGAADAADDEADGSSKHPGPGLTVWVRGGVPVAYSRNVETVLFRPPSTELLRFTLGAEDDADDDGDDAGAEMGDDGGDARQGILDRQAEYGAVSVGGGDAGCVDMRTLLERLNAVSAAQSRLQGKPAPTVPDSPLSRSAIGLISGHVTLVAITFGRFPTSRADFVAAADNLRNRNAHFWWASESILWSLAAGRYVQVACISPSRARFATGARVLAAIERVLCRPILADKQWPFGASLSLDTIGSAFLRQAARRAGTIARLVTTAQPHPPRRLVDHVASATALSFDMLFGACASLPLILSLGGDALVPRLAASAPALADTLTDPVIAALRWLNDWPLGLKLNTGLSAFLCSSITRALDLWRNAATPVLTHTLPHVPAALALASPLGLSFMIALLADLLALLTLHLRLLYAATAALCRASMAALLGLWDLFRGRRWNVLRHRTDSHAFDLDTLFLGTLLFTVTAFLAPTVLAYGLLFAFIYAAIAALQRLLALSIAGLNCSVLFQLLSRVLPTTRLPDGIVFDVASPPTRPAGRASGEKAAAAPSAADEGGARYPARHVLELKSTPVGVGTLLRRWWRETVRTA